jgi:hypothetical protein
MNLTPRHEGILSGLGDDGYMDTLNPYIENQYADNRNWRIGYEHGRRLKMLVENYNDIRDACDFSDIGL